MGGLAHDLGDLHRLVQAERVAADHGQQDAGGALDAVPDERRRDGTTRRLAAAARAARHADAHQRRPRVAHDRAHVGEVEVDQARRRDQVADALHALAQDVVGDAERVDHRRAPVEHGQQPVVRDRHQRVDRAAELERCRRRPATSGERPRIRTASSRCRPSAHPAHARSAPPRARRRCRCRRPRRLRRTRGRSRAAPRGSSASDSSAARRPTSGSEPEPRPSVIFWPMWILTAASAERELLRVGVDGQELDAADLGLDHPVHRVDARPADADDTDHGQVRGRLGARRQRHRPRRRGLRRRARPRSRRAAASAGFGGRARAAVSTSGAGVTSGGSSGAASRDASV